MRAADVPESTELRIAPDDTLVYAVRKSDAALREDEAARGYSASYPAWTRGGFARPAA